MGLSRSTFVRSAAGAAAASLAAAPRIVRAQAPTTLRAIFFPSADVLPWWVGIEQGFFARNGVTVTLTPTPGSVYQFQHLASGDFELALTAIDNAVAYDEGQGQAPLPKPADFVAFLGCDNGFLRLYARPDVKTYADLRGKSLAVDALTTGFAFVLRKMLERNGLHEGDYTLEPVGGTPARYDRLIAGTTAATLLTVPFDLLARTKGYTNLGTASDVLGPYQGLCTVASKAWLNANLDAATRYTRGYLQALDWIFDRANAAAAQAVLVREARITPDLAPEVYRVLLDPKLGLARRAQMDVAGIRTVLALRSEYGRPQKTFGDPLKYYDDRAYRAATSR